MSTEKFVITIFSPATIPYKSGAGLNAFNLAKHYVKQGYKVRIVSFNYSKSVKKETIDGIQIRRIRVYYNNFILKVYSYIFLIPIYSKFVLKSDVSILYGPLQGYMYILILGKLMNKKILFRSTMLGRDDVISLIYKFGNLISKPRKIIIGFMYGYISQSPAMSERFCQIYSRKIPFIERAQGVDSEKYFPVDKFKKIKLRKELNLPLNKKVILSVGYVIDRKGYIEIINALKSLKGYDFLYVVIGCYDPVKGHYMYSVRDEMQAIYKQALEILPDKIQFIGESDIVEKYLQCADLFILNSKQEGMPNVLLEAMAVALPIVVKKIEGIDGFISKHNKTALVIENEVQITKAVEKLLLDDELSKRISLNAKDLILESYTMKKVSKRILNKLT